MIVSNEWRNAESYSEHIIAPRLEWLIDLNILIKNEKHFILTPNGTDFVSKFPNINEIENIIDVNKNFLNQNRFNILTNLFLDANTYDVWESLNDSKQNEILGDCLLLFSKILKSGSALRIALEPSLLFSSIYLLCEKNVLVEFNEIIKKLQESFYYKNKRFKIKTSARMNEGYINIKLEN